MIICRTLATYKGRPLLVAPRTDPGVRCYRTGLLPRMCDEEPLFRPWVDAWQIAIGDQLHPSPRQPMLLASSPNGTKPAFDQVMTKRSDRRRIACNFR